MPWNLLSHWRLRTRQWKCSSLCFKELHNTNIRSGCNNNRRLLMWLREKERNEERGLMKDLCTMNLLRDCWIQHLISVLINMTGWDWSIDPYITLSDVIPKLFSIGALTANSQCSISFDQHNTINITVECSMAFMKRKKCVWMAIESRWTFVQMLHRIYWYLVFRNLDGVDILCSSSFQYIFFAPDAIEMALDRCDSCWFIAILIRWHLNNVDTYFGRSRFSFFFPIYFRISPEWNSKWRLRSVFASKIREKKKKM